MRRPAGTYRSAITTSSLARAGARKGAGDDSVWAMFLSDCGADCGSAGLCLYDVKYEPRIVQASSSRPLQCRCRPASVRAIAVCART